jgi:hypothetical protein
MLFDVEDDLREAREGVQRARQHAPATIPPRSADPTKAIPDVLLAIEKLSAALEKISGYLLHGRGGGGPQYPG